MWKKVKPLLVILSVAVNVAFVAMWIRHALATHPGLTGPGAAKKGDETIWCPLHQRLGTSEEQWRRIEPSMEAFRRSSQSLCGSVGRLRLEMIDLIAAPQEDLDAIRVKQEAIFTIQRKMQDLVVEHLIAEKQVLTPEQQSELFGLIRKSCSCPGHGPLWGPGIGGKCPKSQARRDRSGDGTR